MQCLITLYKVIQIQKQGIIQLITKETTTTRVPTQQMNNKKQMEEINQQCMTKCAEEAENNHEGMGNPGKR